jgi:phospholipid/cholesterol/gamma-HCH transport system substrate-binding protein
MNESPNKRAIIVGAFILIGLILLLAGVMIIGNVHETFKNKIKVVTLFDDINGLQKGNNIWFSGVKIGTVHNIQFYGNSQVKIVMNIETKAQPYIRKDAKVKISTDGLIGNKILVIYGGTDKFEQVEEGDTLGVEKTFSSEDMINTLQENNKNFLEITNDFKKISKKIANGEGSIGQLINDTLVYRNIAATTMSLQIASLKAQLLIADLEKYAQGFNKKGSLANELITDTVLFNSLKGTAEQLQKIADSAAAVVTDIKQASNNPNTPVGLLLHDEKTGAQMKETIKNLESSSKKLDEDLEALQHNILFRRYFKKKGKEQVQSIGYGYWVSCIR